MSMFYFPWSHKDHEKLHKIGIRTYNTNQDGLYRGRNGITQVTRAEKREGTSDKWTTIALKFQDRKRAAALEMLSACDLQYQFCTTIKSHFLVDCFKVVANANWLWIPMEICNFNIAQAKLIVTDAQTEGIPEEQGRTWFAMVMDALRYMHHKGWTHRNIEPASILLKSDDRVVLGGFSQVFPCKRGSLATDLPNANVWWKGCGPRRVAGGPYDPYAEDMYSLGLVMFSMMADNCSMNEVEDDIVQPMHVQAFLNHGGIEDEVKSSKLSREGKDLILSLTRLNEAERPIMRKVIKHPWVIGNPDPKSPYAQWPHARPGARFGQEFVPDEGTWDDKNYTFPTKVEAAGYKIEYKIGAGSFGSVYKAWKGNQALACKVVDIKKANVKSPRYAARYTKEMDIITSYHHPNICKVFDLFIERNRRGNRGTRKWGEDRKVFIFMELCINDLQGICRMQQNKRLHEVYARTYLLGVAKGLNYLHMKRVAHRDMKMANILVRSKTQACVTDFSFSKETPHFLPANTFLGTMKYRSPEILAEDKGYDPYAADVWAYGICIVYTVTGHHVFNDNMANNKSYLKAILKDYMDYIKMAEISDQARDLVHKCMAWRERDRIPFATVMKHEWFTMPREKLTYGKFPEGFPVPDPVAPPPPLLLKAPNTAK